MSSKGAIEIDENEFSLLLADAMTYRNWNNGSLLLQ